MMTIMITIYKVQIYPRFHAATAHSLRLSNHNHQVIFVANGACWVCLCCHNPLNSDMDYRIFIVRTDVNGGVRTLKESQRLGPRRIC